MEKERWRERDITRETETDGEIEREIDAVAMPMFQAAKVSTQISSGKQLAPCSGLRNPTV
jgi:hypothetical protein